MSTKTAQTFRLDVSNVARQFSRADLEILGIDHSGVSYEGRVFFDNAGADEKTERTLASGYAGSFHVFGHGGCYGDEGHCEVPAHRQPYDHRLPHPLEPYNSLVVVTDALRERLSRRTDELSVTIVPVIRDRPAWIDSSLYDEPVSFKRLGLVTYD